MKDEAERRESNRDRVLALLQQKGKAGATNADLLGVGGFRYGARLFELRRMGYIIETLPAGEGLFRFVLRGIRAEQPSLFKEVTA